MTTNGITTLGNRTFLFGGASGIDTSALITAAYNVRKSEADKIDAQVTTNTNKYNAYEKVQSLGTAVQTALSNIKKNYSVLSQNQGLFDKRTGTLSGTSATNLMTVSIDPGTDLGSYDIEVLAKAKVQKVGSTTPIADSTTDLGYAGTFDINLAGKTASTVNITADMSLSEIATAINASSTTTGVKASVIQSATNNYQLVLSGTDTAKDISISNITGTDVLQSLGVTSGGSTFTNVIQPSSTAQVAIDGVTYTRDTNDFSGIITGVDITVKSALPGTISTLSVENDNSGVKEGIQNFITAYNNLRDYIKSQQAVSDKGEVDSSVVLFGDTLLKSITSSVQGAIAGSYGSGGTNLSTLREVGITLDQDNKLVMDENTFDTALIDKFDQVADLFTSKVTTDNSSLRMMANTSSAGAMNFAMDITYSGGAITGVSVGGNSSLFTVSGQTIVGVAGTAYEGMTFAYVGTSNATINVNIQQGFGDMMDSTVDLFADVLTGTLHTQMLNISSQNTQLESRSARVLERANDYRDRLIEKYASLESQMASAQTVLLQLQAILGTNKSN